MPTKLKRIYITPTPELHEALMEFREVSGQSPASLISSLLSEASPVIRAMSEAYRQARKGPATALKPLQEISREIHIGFAQMQLEMDAVAKQKKKRVRKSTK